jgi:hypothetical protein
MSIVGGASLSPLTTPGSLAVSMAVWGIGLGGMYRLALKQIDGHSIGINDLVSGTDVLPNLALASLLAAQGALAGFVCLVIPGWIVSGIIMFTLPLVVDARKKLVEAIAESWKTLKDQWLLSGVFALVLWAMQLVGLLFCGLGFLVVLPLSVLSQAIVYRDFFPRAGAPKKPAQDEDTEFGPVALATRPEGRIPGWVWLAASAGLLLPLLVPLLVFSLGIALFFGLFSSARRDIQENNDKAFHLAIRDFEKRGQDAAQAPAQPGMPAKNSEFVPILGRPAINDVNRAIEGLKGSIFARQTALRWLIATKPVDAEPDRARVASALAPLLADSFVDVEAATALAAWATRDQVPFLISALENPHISVQRMAEEALRRLADDRGLAALAEQEKRRETRHAIPPIERRPGPDLSEDMRKLMERHKAGSDRGEEMPKLKERRARQLREKPADRREGRGAARQDRRCWQPPINEIVVGGVIGGRNQFVGLTVVTEIAVRRRHAENDSAARAAHRSTPSKAVRACLAAELNRNIRINTSRSRQSRPGPAIRVPR